MCAAKSSAVKRGLKDPAQELFKFYQKACGRCWSAAMSEEKAFHSMQQVFSKQI